MVPFWVYILKCNDDSYYTGHTDNLERRVGMHREGKVDGYTASRLPVTLAFSEQFATRLEALEMEQRIKGWSRKKKEAMMRGDWKEVSRLAKNRSQDSVPSPAHGSTSSPRTGKISSVRPEPVEGHENQSQDSVPLPAHGSTSSPRTGKISSVRPEPVEGHEKLEH